MEKITLASHFSVKADAPLTEKKIVKFSISALRDAFNMNEEESARYRKYYGANAFDIWLNVMLPKFVHEACNIVDREDRRFTLGELKSLVRLYVRSKPFGYTFLTPANRPQADAEMIACWISGLDGYGHAAMQALYRDRVPVVEGILTKEFWEGMSGKKRSQNNTRH